MAEGFTPDGPDHTLTVLTAYKRLGSISLGGAGTLRSLEFATDSLHHTRSHCQGPTALAVQYSYFVCSSKNDLHSLAAAQTKRLEFTRGLGFTTNSVCTDKFDPRELIHRVRI